MGLLTTVKETLLDDAEGVGDRTDDRARPTPANESAGAVGLADAAASEADLVVAKGRTRSEALLELVAVNGGRVKQAELVRRTDWSKSTVSRYLGELEEEGAVDRVPVGRYKVVLLPDESLFDETWEGDSR